MSESQPTHHDAEIILKLYDLRREPVMREARAFVAQFAPKSLDDVLKVAHAFGTKSRLIFVRWPILGNGSIAGESRRDQSRACP